MGIDAPSTDLTARIRARRKANVANGEVEPALPGEHALHGRGGVDIERLSAAHAAQDRRAARSAALPEVTDYSALEVEEDAQLRLSADDGGDTLEDPTAIAEVAAADEPPLPDEALEPHDFDLGTGDALTAQELSEAKEVVDSWQSDAVQAEILEQVRALHTRLDGQDAALLLVAQAISGLSDDNAVIAGLLGVMLKRTPEPSPWYSRAWRWLRTPR